MDRSGQSQRRRRLRQRSHLRQRLERNQNKESGRGYRSASLSKRSRQLSAKSKFFNAPREDFGVTTNGEFSGRWPAGTHLIEFASSDFMIEYDVVTVDNSGAITEHEESYLALNTAISAYDSVYRVAEDGLQGGEEGPISTAQAATAQDVIQEYLTFLKTAFVENGDFPTANELTPYLTMRDTILLPGQSHNIFPSVE